MITIDESFYHYTWVVKKNEVVIGTLGASDVIKPYQSPLCFHIGGVRLSSDELRDIANLLDKTNGDVL